jgi:cytoskeletal protein CcmA (bactofilin family)
LRRPPSAAPTARPETVDMHTRDNVPYAAPTPSMDERAMEAAEFHPRARHASPLRETASREAVVPIEGRPQAPLTVLSEADALVGQLLISGDGHLMGSFEGQVDCAGALLIGKDARVRADVRAQNVLLAGSVKGTVVAKGRLELTSSGRLEGEARTASLVIQEGAVHFGRLEVYPGGVPELAPGPPPPPRPASVNRAISASVHRVKKVWGELF